MTWAGFRRRDISINADYKIKPDPAPAGDFTVITESLMAGHRDGAISRTGSESEAGTARLLQPGPGPPRARAAAATMTFTIT